MLKIRLQRVGRKHEPSFRLVLTDSQNSTKSGRFAEVLGNYDPRKSTETIKTDRVKELLSKGVLTTGSVNNLLVKKGIVTGKKTHVGKDYVAPAPKAVETPAETQVESTPAEPVAEAPAVEPQAVENTPTEEAAPAQE